MPVVLAGKPSAHRLIVGIGHTCVSEYAVSHTALQRLGYGGIGLEVHVCHPEGYDVVRRSRVPLVGVGAATLCRLSEELVGAGHAAGSIV